ncbi:MAG: FkbM family methyltransferase [Pseudomonadota bacterium]|nr:FkbM family methyltransferase [Pseudomonadota bacterium]
MKRMLKRLLAMTPYRIVRYRGANRFNEIGKSLRDLRTKGFAPTLVVDGGAHVGDFARMAGAIFPAARIVMFEPQAGCRAALDELARAPRIEFRAAALSDPEAAERGSVTFAASDRPTTGARVIRDDADDEVQDLVEVPATTLDREFAGVTSREERVLLKLDLQGHEIAALSGAATFLRDVEVVLSEASFYMPTADSRIADLVAFMRTHGFVLYDVASITGRARDNRARDADLVFVRADSPLALDDSWG